MEFLLHHLPHQCVVYFANENGSILTPFWQSTSTNQFGISADGSIMEFTTVNAAQEVVIRITLRTGRMDQNPMRFASRQ